MSGTQAAANRATSVVTLDVFSGRPNPSWTLSAAETQELQRQIDALATRATGPPALPDLGYRSVQVVTTAAQGTVALTVGRGVVGREENGTVINFQDQGRALERWLVATGKPHVDASLFHYVNGEIAGHP